MDDNELDISSLIDKYENMRALGKKIYFDADEFAMLAEYYNSGDDNDEAAQLIEEGLKMHPGSQALILMKAKLLVYITKYEEALEYLKIMSNDTDLDQPLLKIEALLHLERYEEAEKLSNQIIKQDLAEDDYYFFITEVGFLLNDVDLFDKSISFLEKAMKINKSNPDVIVDLAYAYEMKGDMPKAIEYNNLLLDIDPYSFDAWVNIGKLYSMNELYGKAIDSYDFALTIKENDLSVIKMKALSHYLNENVDEAIKLFRKCLSLSPNDESVYDSLLEAYAAIEQYDEMMNLIDLKEEQLGSDGILAKRAFVYINKEEYETARSIFDQIPENEKDSLDYFMLEGEITFYDGKLAESEAAYIKAALISEGNEDILDRLANICVIQEKYTHAAEYLEELLEISPDFPTAKSRLAFIRFEIGSKDPFDEIMNQFTDDELRELLGFIFGNEETDFKNFNREKIITRLNEARENRVLFKNIKY